MARIKFSGMIEELNPAVDDIAKAIIKESTPIMVKEYKASAKESATGERNYLFGGHATGEAISKVRGSRPKKNNCGHFSVTYSRGSTSVRSWGSKNPDAKFKEPIRNNDKLYWLQYGTEKKGVAGPQPPRPFLERAYDKAEPQVHDQMQETYERLCMKK